MTNTEIIIDTNAWMAVGKFHVPLFQEIERLFGSLTEISPLSGTVEELEKIKLTSKGKEKLAAKLAIQIIQKKVNSEELILTESKGYVDDLLVVESKGKKLILTADKELQGRLTPPFLIIKQKRYLELLR